MSPSSVPPTCQSHDPVHLLHSCPSMTNTCSPALPLLFLPPSPISPSPIYHCSINQLLCGVEPSQTLCKITAHNYWPEHDCDGNTLSPTPPLKERQTDGEGKRKKGQDTKKYKQKTFDRAAGRLVDKAKAEQNTTSSHTGGKRTKVYAESTFGQSYWKVSRQSQAREEQWLTPTLTPPTSIEMTNAYAERTTDLDRVTVWTVTERLADRTRPEKNTDGPPTPSPRWKGEKYIYAGSTKFGQSCWKVSRQCWARAEQGLIPPPPPPPPQPQSPKRSKYREHLVWTAPQKG